MYRTVASSSSPLPVPPQSKVVLQRQHREREGECFNAFRGVINELTGEELQKRQEILRKAIDLLLAALEIRKQREAQVVHPTSYEKHALTTEDATRVHSHSAEPSHWPQSWHYSAEFDTQSPHYVSQFNDQQHHLTMNTDLV